MTKYKNKHLKEAILPQQVIFCICIIGAAFGIFILSFGLIRAAWQFNHVKEFSEVLSQVSNQANKMVYIDIISVPEKISEDEHEGYYLVVTEEGNYISGMQEEQFEDLKKTVEANGQTRLYGMTKVVLDEAVKKDAGQYLNENNIHIRVTNFTYADILKEGYIVNLILGIIFALGFGIMAIGACYALKKYKNPQWKLIDAECCRKDAIWLWEYKMYLTKNYIVTTSAGITAFEISFITEVNLFESEETGQTILEGTMLDESKVTIWTDYQTGRMYEEDVRYLEDIFRKKNIDFKCHIELFPEEEE